MLVPEKDFWVDFRILSFLFWLPTVNLTHCLKIILDNNVIGIYEHKWMGYKHKH